MKITMKIYTCDCLFDYYAYLLYDRKGHRYQKHDVGGSTFTLCDRDLFVQVPWMCLFSILNVKNLDAYDLNKKLRRVCKFCLSDLTISRLHEHSKTWFEKLQAYLRATDFEPGKTMSVWCVRCLKFFICHIFIFDLYVLAI